MKKLSLAILVAAMLMLVTAPVQAALVYDLEGYGWAGLFTSDHITNPTTGQPPGGGTPPFGFVGLTQAGSNVTFHVELNAGSGFVRTGAGDGLNFVFNGVDVAVADISGTGLTANNVGYFPFNQPPAGTIHANGTGDWQFGVFFNNQGTGGGNAIYNAIEFTVLNATIAQLTVGNGSNIFAADIISGQTGYTGMIDVTSAVPIPAAAWLLGTGLMGLVAIRYRKK